MVGRNTAVDEIPETRIHPRTQRNQRESLETVAPPRPECSHRSGIRCRFVNAQPPEFEESVLKVKAAVGQQHETDEFFQVSPAMYSCQPR